MKLSLNNVVPDLRDHFDEGLCSFDELISLGVILATLWNKVVICTWYMTHITIWQDVGRLRESLSLHIILRWPYPLIECNGCFDDILQHYCCPSLASFFNNPIIRKKHLSEIGCSWLNKVQVQFSWGRKSQDIHHLNKLKLTSSNFHKNRRVFTWQVHFQFGIFESLYFEKYMT